MRLAFDLGRLRIDSERVEAVAQRALARDPASLGPPAENEWPLGDDALAFLLEANAALRPRTILELGSGRSTVALAQEVEADQRVVSLDDDRAYLEATRAKLPAGAPVDLHHAPVARMWMEGAPFQGYAIPPAARATLEERGADLVLIDGPGPVQRNATLYTIWPYLNPGAWVMLDDAGRVDNELSALITWHRAARERASIYFLSSFERGLGLVVVPAGGRGSQLRPHRRERAFRWFQYARRRG